MHREQQQLVVAQTRAFVAAMRGFAFAGLSCTDPTGMYTPFVLQGEVDLAGNAFSGQVLLAVLLALVAGVDWSLVLGQRQQFTEAKQKSKPAAAAAGQVAAEDNAESEACDEGEGMESEKQDSFSDDGSDFSRSQLQRGSPCIVALRRPNNERSNEPWFGDEEAARWCHANQTCTP